MAAASLPVDYHLNKTINRELQGESAAALAAACRALPVPVLLLQDGQDPRPAAACDTLAHALPAATRIVVPHAGHLPWIEAAGETGMMLRNFLTHLEGHSPA